MDRKGERGSILRSDRQKEENFEENNILLKKIQVLLVYQKQYL